MKYYATLKHHSIIGYWAEIKATTLSDAKRKATMEYGKGYIGHVINLVECADKDADRVNDIPPYIKIIGDDKWSYTG